MHVSRDAKSPEHALVAYATGTLKVRQTAGHVFFFCCFFVFSKNIYAALQYQRENCRSAPVTSQAHGLHLQYFLVISRIQCLW